MADLSETHGPMGTEGGSWREWITGIVGAFLVAGLVGALSQAQTLSNATARNDLRIAHLEQREAGRDADHDAIVDMRADLRAINLKLDRVIATLDRAEQ